MPLFTFRCVTCKTEVDRIVKSETKSVECPNCSGLAEKQLSAPGGFDLRGDGFYRGTSPKSTGK